MSWLMLRRRTPKSSGLSFQGSAGSCWEAIMKTKNQNALGPKCLSLDGVHDQQSGFKTCGGSVGGVTSYALKSVTLIWGAKQMFRRHDYVDSIEALPKACLEESLDALCIIKCMRNTSVQVASRLIKAGLEVGLGEFFIVKCMQNT